MSCYHSYLYPCAPLCQKSIESRQLSLNCKQYPSYVVHGSGETKMTVTDLQIFLIVLRIDPYENFSVVFAVVSALDYILYSDIQLCGYLY